MNPIAFYVFGISIKWYGIFIATGLLLAIAVAWRTCRYRSIRFDAMLDILLFALPAAIVGARLYYVAFEFSRYKDNLWEIFNIRQGGLAIHGGIIFALVAAYIVARIKKINFLNLIDVAAPSIILAQGIGRWGNFMNGEAHGGPVSYEFIRHFPEFIQKGMLIDGTYYHPTFLYESAWDLLVSAFLIVLLIKSKKPGLVFFTYVGLYSIGRFFIEGLRTDSLMFGPIRVAQLVSVIGVLIWIAFLIITLVQKRIRNEKHV
jgi:phosphatidylglycerol:prolipoprotein diacylglycerol transferase